METQQQQAEVRTHVDPEWSACELLLNRHTAVHEATLLRRIDTQGAERVVAYVVPSATVAPERLCADLDTLLPHTQRPDAWVLLSALPRSDDGRIDRAALARFEVLDADLAERWEHALGTADGHDACAVIPVTRQRRIATLHRRDLLPVAGRRPSPADASAVAAPAAIAETPGQTPGQTPRQSRGIRAIADGGPLAIAADAPATLAAALQRAAGLQPAHGVHCVRRDGAQDFQTYPQLLAEARRLHAQLAGMGLRPGDTVLFQLADGREFLTAFWACVLGGMVPALVSAAAGYAPDDPATQRLLNAWRLLDGPPILSDAERIAELRAALGDAAADSVHALQTLPPAATLPAAHSAQPDDLALLLFTSGSTGTPKGVMQTHRSLLSMSLGTIQMNGFTDRDVTLNWMPLEHVGAISFLHIMAVVLACRQVHVTPEHILDDPLRWPELLHEFGASISWGPNFAFKLLNERARDMQARGRAGRWDLSSLYFLVSAGEQVVGGTVQRCLQLLSGHGLPDMALRPAFGMSETCSGITWSSGYRQADGAAGAHAIDLGAPIPSAHLRIVDAAGRILDEGEIGRLQVSGPSVTPGYYRHPEANAQAFTADGWFDTGDLGFLRAGRLTLTGREKDEIIVNGINYVAAEIEAAVDAVPGVEVSWSAACAVRAPHGDGDELAIFFVPKAADEQRRAPVLRSIRSAVAAAFGINPAYLIPVAPSAIPKTAIGKIQRAQLKRRFEAGEFEAPARAADLLAGIDAVPAWFHRRVWRPQPVAQRQALQDAGTTLVFSDARGLGDVLCRRLRAAGLICVAVEAGSGFQSSGDTHYRIDPACADDYRRLLRAVAETLGTIGSVVHAFSYAPAAPVDSVDALADAQRLGLFSVLHLVQALADVQGDAVPVALYVVGQGGQVTGAGDAADCIHAALPGLLKSVSQEMDWLRCRHVDFADGAPDAQAACVVDELQCVTRAAEVAYRDGRRLVWELAPVRFDGAAARGGADREPIRRGGIYLITGGLGGIGAFLAQSLIRDYGIKAVLIGASELPPRERWQDFEHRDGKLAERVRRYRDIEAAGEDACLYAAADVADLAGLRGIVAAAEARWNGTLAGIFHLAVAADVAAHWSDMQRFAVRNETPQSLAALLRTKVYGTWALYRLAQERRDCIVVPFGSVLGVFGAAYFAGYSAVHAFQHSLALQQRHRAGLRSFNICWAVWEDIGLSRDEPAFAKDFYRATGYGVIPKELGYDCLLAGLWHDTPELIVGLDDNQAPVARHIPAQSRPLQALAAFRTAPCGEGPGGAQAATLTVRDAFGTPVHCDCVEVEVLPRRADGRIDRQALADEHAAQLRGAAGGAAPQTDTEQRLLAIWRDILPARRIGIHDSFFQLGGNSLGATRLLSRLRQDLRVALDMRELFAHATVHALAGLVDRKQPNAQPAADGLEDTQTLLERIDAMPDGEVAALLARLQAAEARP